LASHITRLGPATPRLLFAFESVQDDVFVPPQGILLVEETVAYFDSFASDSPNNSGRNVFSSSFSAVS
jgi:hypothetical protein